MASSIKKLVGKNLQVFATTSKVPDVVSDSTLWGSIILTSYLGGDDALVPYIVFGNGKTHQISGSVGFTNAEGVTYSADEWTTYITSMYHQVMSTYSYMLDTFSETSAQIETNTNEIRSLRDDTNTQYRDARETLSQLTTRIDNIDATGNEQLIEEFNTRLQQTSEKLDLTASHVTSYYTELANLKVAYDGLYSYVIDSYSYTKSYIPVVAGQMIAEFIGGGDGPDGSLFATKLELQASYNSLFSRIQNTYSYSNSYISQEIDKITSYVQDAYAYNKSYIMQSYNIIHSYVADSYNKLNSSITQTAQSISLAVTHIDNLNTGINGLNTRITALEVGTGEINAYANSFNIWKTKTSSGTDNNYKYAYVDSNDGLVVTKGKFFGDVEATSFNAISPESGFSMKMNNSQIQFWTNSFTSGPVGYFYWDGTSMNLAMYDGESNDGEGEYKIINFSYWKSANSHTVQYANISHEYVFHEPRRGYDIYDNNATSFGDYLSNIVNSDAETIIAMKNGLISRSDIYRYLTPYIKYVDDDTTYYTTGINKYEVKTPNVPDAAHNRFIINGDNFDKNSTTYYTGILLSLEGPNDEVRTNYPDCMYDVYALNLTCINNGNELETFTTSSTNPVTVNVHYAAGVICGKGMNINNPATAVSFAKVESDDTVVVCNSFVEASKYNEVVQAFLNQLYPE